jgi:predicted ATPase
VRLFLSRSDAVRGGVVFGPGDLEAVATICRRLDGIPLAIELAAARTRSLSPADIAARLDQRFDLLTGGRRTAVERHQTLRATLDWSFDMLPNEEQLLFGRMAVFASWFDLDAIVAVCADAEVPSRHVVGLVDELVAKSMLVAEAAGSTRFRLLETLRQYGLETLDTRGELDRWRDAHASYIGRFAASLGLDGSGWPLDTDVDRAVAALDDVRLARSWLQTRGEAASMAALVLDLYVLVVIGSVGTEEWNRWCSEALSLDLDPTVRGPLLARLAFGRQRSGEIAAAVVDAEAALALGPDPVAYTALAFARMWQQRFDDMDAAIEAGYRAYPDIVGFATAYRRVSAFGIMGQRTSSLEERRAERDVLIDALRGVDSAPMVSYLHLCAAASLVTHDPAEALVHAREALRVGARFPMIAAFGNFDAGHASMFTGRKDDAVRHYTAALDPMLRAGLVYVGMVPVLDALAMVALPDDPAWSWTIVGHRRRVVAQHGDHPDFTNPDSRQVLETSLPPESEFSEHVRRGSAMSTAELAAHARSRLESLEATQ